MIETRVRPGSRETYYHVEIGLRDGGTAAAEYDAAAGRWVLTHDGRHVLDCADPDDPAAAQRAALLHLHSRGLLHPEAAALVDLAQPGS